MYFFEFPLDNIILPRYLNISLSPLSLSFSLSTNYWLIRLDIMSCSCSFRRTYCNNKYVIVFCYLLLVLLCLQNRKFFRLRLQNLSPLLYNLNYSMFSNILFSTPLPVCITTSSILQAVFYRKITLASKMEKIRNRSHRGS